VPSTHPAAHAMLLSAARDTPAIVSVDRIRPEEYSEVRS
jgi:hypothetical protein